jgi:integrase
VSPAGDVRRPAVSQDVSTTPGLTRDQVRAMSAAADSASGPHRLRSAAVVSVLLLIGARVSEITGADIEDLDTDRGHRVLWVTRKGGKRQVLALPAPAAEPGSAGRPRPRRPPGPPAATTGHATRSTGYLDTRWPRGSACLMRLEDAVTDASHEGRTGNPRGNPFSRRRAG